MALLFVYGSLKRGFPAHYKLEGHPAAEFIGEAVTELATYNLIPDAAEAFPFMFKGQHKVSGELYKVTPLKLKICDSFEGVPYLYYRPEISVYNAVTGEVAWANAYLGTESAKMNHVLKYASVATAFDPVTNVISWRGKRK